MKVIKPNYTVLTDLNGPDILKHIEKIGRTCYKSEDKITEYSAKKFVVKLIKMGHESVLEHSNISVIIVGSRAISHQLIRHTIASFSQESQRFCSYNKDKFGSGLTFIKPAWCCSNSSAFSTWKSAMLACEERYLELINIYKASPQEARGVLPNDVRTEINITANLREWRHIFKLRCSDAAHPSMRELMIPLLKEFQYKIPVVFDDIKTGKEVTMSEKKNNEFVSKKTKYIAFDCETGGLGHDKSLLTVYFGVYVYENNVFKLTDELYLYTKPNDGCYQVTAEALNINKINLVEHDKKAISYSKAGGLLRDFLIKNSENGSDRLVPVGHNVAFDIQFINAKLLNKYCWNTYVNYRSLDSGVISQFLIACGSLDSEKAGLGAIAEQLGVKPIGPLHDAKTDAILSLDVVDAMVKLVNKGN